MGPAAPYPSASPSPLFPLRLVREWLCLAESGARLPVFLVATINSMFILNDLHMKGGDESA